ncbi:Putative DNA ligase-like protein [Anaerohalosphaera lusitana]|uniref:Putative DNA ligase-like protein n=1 Tax=Anaerohalosphaera lusitana TaxID=1936003 RepID=A0A1U9NLC7_9BACT|nr:DNA polymerase ligase N-terminal domain-containing protein [Anaerohalosphaera lusitana]AQT68538.1 Putative DNA ligase-like protein [Anaerohalosphaera lusitana]
MPADELRRFVIQKHTRPGDTHWDFMLESGQSLLTWRLPECPAELAKSPDCPAVKIFDHPLRFLTYEGPVNQGTGDVKIEEAGTCLFHENRAGLISFELHGELLDGQFELRRQEDDRWLLKRLGPGR